MTKNLLDAVSNSILEALDYLSDRDIEGEKLQEEMQRADSIVKLSKQAIDLHRAQTERATKYAEVIGVKDSKQLMIESL